MDLYNGVFHSMIGLLVVLMACLAFGSPSSDYTSWNGPLYSISVLPPNTSPDPRVFGRDPYEGADEMQIVREDGTILRCSLPSIIEDEDVSPDGEGINVTEVEVLSPLRGNCLHMLSGWWTYEFCYEKHVKQYHLEPTGEQSAIFVLGRFRKDDVDDEAKEDSDQEVAVATDYYSLFYTGGTRCDLTGEPRDIEIRLTCDLSDRVGQMVAIKEPATCSYILYVRTGLLCKHPAYAKKDKTINHIICTATEEVQEQAVDGAVDDGAPHQPLDGEDATAREDASSSAMQEEMIRRINAMKDAVDRGNNDEYPDVVLV